MASMVPCPKNTAGYVTYISLVSQADTKIFKAAPTLAAGDFIIAIDDGAPANLATLPVVDADYTKRVKVVLSQAETNGDNLTIICSDASGAEWCDLTINIQTAAQTLDATDVVADAVKVQTDKMTFTVANKMDSNVYTWNGTAVHATTEAGTPCVEVVRWGGNDIAATAVNGVPKVAVTHVNAAAQTATLDTIKAETVLIVEDTGTTLPAAFVTLDAVVDTVKVDTAAILIDTAVIGALGAGLTAVPWNAAWDAEVQSEVEDALTGANTELATVPTTTGGLRAMIQFLFEKVRNKGTMNKTTGVETLFKEDSSTALGTATHADDGTVVSRGEMN